MFHISVTSPNQRDTLQHDGGPIELGRNPKGGGATLTMPGDYISRRQLRLEQTDDGRISVENLGSSVVLNDDQELGRGESGTLDLPAVIVRGQTRIVLSAQATAADHPGGGPVVELQTICDPIRGHASSARGTLSGMGNSPGAEQLARWFETLIAVQKSAGGSRAFFDETARAIVELVGMDRGVVVLRENGAWRVSAAYPPDARDSQDFSRTVLDRVFHHRRSYFETAPDATGAKSLSAVDAYVASPIFSAQDDVAGVVFGARNSSGSRNYGVITPFEAQIVQMLASTVSVGMARVAQESQAARLHVQLEQFASPELVRELEREPDLFEPTTREITVLFCDLRGFSRICESLAPPETYALVSDVMERLTQCITDHDGYVIDFLGDGIGAMWNAPTLREDHARRACRAALAMQAQMPLLSDRWRDQVGGPLRLGVGVNTGVAQVGNGGSKARLKYSPMGSTVNLASRVEGATKQLGVPALIAASTRQALGPDVATRRLWPVRVMGIQQPVTLYELAAPDVDDRWRAFRDDYEGALDHFENGRPAEAARLLEKWRNDELAANDVATLRLRGLIEEPPCDTPFDPVWNLDRK